MSSYSFNTTLVQLKDSSPIVPKNLISRFNTTLVQLKVHCAHAGVEVAAGFNTTLVQLKGPPPLGGNASGAAFQYHSGPIKRFSSFILVLIVLLFQYHSGPIKRRCSSASSPTRFPSFQYHSGPIKSGRPHQGDGLVPLVSIPLWSN